MSTLSWTRAFAHSGRPGEEISLRLSDKEVLRWHRDRWGETHEDRQGYASAIRAKWEFDRRCHQTEAEGWSEVKGTEPYQPVAREDFESELLAQPEDIEIRLVYADWLTQAGDPWGELISVQNAIDNLPRRGAEGDRRRLRRHEMTLMFSHAARFWGRLGTTVADVATQTYISDRIRAVWRSGFLMEAMVTWTEEPLPMSFEDFIHTLAGLDTAVLLTDLRLRNTQWGDELIRALGEVSWGQLQRLEVLLDTEAGRWRPFDGQALCPLLLGTAAPRLEKLVVYGTHNTDRICETLRASPLARSLKVLRLHSGRFTDAGLRALLDAPFDRLQELRLSGDGLVGAEPRLAPLASRVMVDAHQERLDEHE